MRWAFNDATLQLVEEMEDGQGRPLWLPNIIGGAPATVLQVPYVVDQAIPDIAAGAKFAYFGDFNRFIVRRVTYMTLKRLVERYAEYDQTGFPPSTASTAYWKIPARLRRWWVNRHLAAKAIISFNLHRSGGFMPAVRCGPWKIHEHND